MNWRQPAAVAALVAGGCIAAAPFYKPQPAPAPIATAETSDPAAPITPVVAPHVSVAPVNSAESSEPSPVPLVELTAEQQEEHWANPVPIEVAGDLPPPLPPVIPVFRNTQVASSKTIQEPVAEMPMIAARRLTPTYAKRKHRIAAGDSLAGLAQRYLGDSNRGAEIVSANPNVLQNPALLPVGKFIEIPMLDGTDPRRSLQSNELITSVDD